MAIYIQSMRREVMRRVYIIFFLRTVVKPFAMKAAFLMVLAASGTIFVSIQQVWGNMPSPAKIAAFIKFVLSAFQNTEFAVQALSLALVVLAVFAFRDLTRVVRFLSARRATVHF